MLIRHLCVRFACVVTLGVATFVMPMAGQTTFEVASVKPSATGGSPAMRCNGGPGTDDAGRFICTNAPLGMLLAIAYDVQANAEVGPGWMMTEGYDIVAKVPAGTTRPQMKVMLQNLVAERLSVKLHREMRETLGSALTVRKGGPTLKPAFKSSVPPAPGQKTEQQMLTSNPEGHWRLTAKGQSMANLAGYLSVQLKQPVSDATGMGGDYDFVLDFWPPWYSGPNPDLVPDIPAALQDQLGLKLETNTQRVEFVVVDSASRVPTEN